MKFSEALGRRRRWRVVLLLRIASLRLLRIPGCHGLLGIPGLAARPHVLRLAKREDGPANWRKEKQADSKAGALAESLSPFSLSCVGSLQSNCKAKKWHKMELKSIGFPGELYLAKPAMLQRR